MKEATGEANMTVITVILISVVAAVATPLVRNMMKRSETNACCAEAGLEAGCACASNSVCQACLDANN